MKTQHKKILTLAFSTLVCVALAIPANAQRDGGSRPATSSGSSGSSARPSGGGGGFSAPRPSAPANVSRPAPIGNSGGVRPQGGFQRGNVGAVRGPVYVDKQGNVIRNGNQGFAPRVGTTVPQRSGNYGYAPRAGAVVTGSTPRGATYGNGGGAYRTSPIVGGGYWGNHGYYHYSHGYYNSYYRPRLGFSIGVLPYGYYPFYFGDYQYFYSDGLYYQYDNNQYTVVEPPVGAEVTVLPDKAQAITINGQQYYELNGVYYQSVTKDDGTTVYQIAGKDGELNTTSTQDATQDQGPQMGDIVNQLPQDCRKIKVNGSTLYVSPDGVYYQQQNDGTYKIVGLPSDEPDQGQN